MYIILSNFDRIRKSTQYFSSYYSIKSIQHNPYKVYKFLKTGVHGKYILIYSRAKFTRLLYLKLMLIWLIKSFYFDFLLSHCPSDIIHYFLTGPSLQWAAISKRIQQHCSLTHKASTYHVWFTVTMVHGNIQVAAIMADCVELQQSI